MALAAADALRERNEEVRRRAEAVFEEQVGRARVRTEPLGADRHERRYWWFSCAPPDDDMAVVTAYTASEHASGQSSRMMDF